VARKPARLIGQPACRDDGIIIPYKKSLIDAEKHAQLDRFAKSLYAPALPDRKDHP
jgi:hypothetical protein